MDPLRKEELTMVVVLLMGANKCVLIRRIQPDKKSQLELTSPSTDRAYS